MPVMVPQPDEERISIHEACTLRPCGPMTVMSGYFQA